MAIDITLARLLVPFVGDTDDLTNAFEKAEKRTKSFTKKLEDIGKVALKGLAVGAAAGAAALGGLGVGMAKLAIDAAPLENITNAFNGIAESAGVGGDAMLTALQKASAGMIDNESLMLSFNKAASLVSEDFATQLPEAMQYLSKVAASTGQDVDFLMDSLVTGVGRVSPMILDNLSIQVDATAANVAYAKSMGKTAEELTKTEQQAALMAQVLEKLEANTAALPDVTEGAAAKMARFETTIKNTKDKIGIGLIPAFDNIMEAVTKLVDWILPPLVDFFERHIAPAIETVTGFFGDFVEKLDSGLLPLEALQGSLETAFGPEITDQVMDIVDAASDLIDKIVEAKDTVLEFLDPISSWIDENVELNDLLIALGGILFVTVVPAIAGVVLAAAPLVLILAGLVGAVALIRKAWEEDWGGIQDKVQDVIDFITIKVPDAIGGLLTLFGITDEELENLTDKWGTHANEQEKATKKIGENVDKHLHFTKRFGGAWDGVIVETGEKWIGLGSRYEKGSGAIASVVTKQEGESTRFGRAWDKTIGVVTGGWDGMKEWWEENQPLLSAHWTSVKDNFNEQFIIPFLEYDNNIMESWDKLVEWWENSTLKEVIGNVWDASIVMLDAMISGAETFKELGSAIVWGIADGIADAWLSFRIWLFELFGDLIDNIEDIFGIGSPSKVFAAIGGQLAEGLAEGIAGGIDLPVSAAFNMSAATLHAGMAGSSTSHYYNLTINTSAPAENVRADFSLMRALAGA